MSVDNKALDGFIDHRIAFTQMAPIVASVFENMSGDGLGNAEISLDSVRQADQMARIRAFEAMAVT